MQFYTILNHYTRNEGSIPSTRSNKYGLFLAFTMF
jgi:hypothetical protein